MGGWPLGRPLPARDIAISTPRRSKVTASPGGGLHPCQHRAPNRPLSLDADIRHELGPPRDVVRHALLEALRRARKGRAAENPDLSIVCVPRPWRRSLHRAALPHRPADWPARPSRSMRSPHSREWSRRLLARRAGKRTASGRWWQSREACRLSTAPAGSARLEPQLNVPAQQHSRDSRAAHGRKVLELYVCHRSEQLSRGAGPCRRRTLRKLSAPVRT